VSSAALYSLFALVTLPLWWPALRVLLGEVRSAADSEPPPPPSRALQVTAPTWGTPRTRLGALAAARRAAGEGRWQGGFGRRSP